MGGGNQRGQPIWFDPRTEGCSQAYGVFRPTMVLSAKVQSQNGAVSSAKSSNLWTFGHPSVLQSTHGFQQGHWLNRFGLPSAGCCMTSYRHRGEETLKNICETLCHLWITPRSTGSQRKVIQRKYALVRLCEQHAPGARLARDHALAGLVRSRDLSQSRNAANCDLEVFLDLLLHLG